jgi:CheY-like chemotaxis protein
MFLVMLRDKYRVSGYSSAKDALERLEEVKPDLLLLDVRMTPISGPECLAAIRGRAGYENLPAIALTALARDEEKAALRATGFQAVVTKPILDQRRLESVIDFLLQNKQIQGETSLHEETSAA